MLFNLPALSISSFCNLSFSLVSTSNPFSKLLRASADSPLFSSCCLIAVSASNTSSEFVDILILAFNPSMRCCKLPSSLSISARSVFAVIGSFVATSFNSFILLLSI